MMKDRNTLRDLMYLGVGTVSWAAHKTEKLTEKLIKQHKFTRDEGEKIVKEYQRRAAETKQEIEKKKDELVDLVNEKVAMSRDQVSRFFDEVMYKPAEAKESMQHKIKDMAEQLSRKTKLTAEEGERMIEIFINELLEQRETLLKKTSDFIDDLEEKVDNWKETGHHYFDELEKRTHDLRMDMKDRSFKAMDKIRKQLHFASTDDVSKLESRVSDLEKNS